VSTLDIFDFDWTLFRSPHPSGTPDKTWWASEDSLLPPNVPLLAPSVFWIDGVVREMRSSQRSPSSMTVVITARRAKTKQRILSLLGQKMLRPEEFYCRSASFAKDKSSVGFKRLTVAKILERRPDIKKVVVWEDTKEQIEGIKDLSKRRGVGFEGHLVSEHPR